MTVNPLPSSTAQLLLRTDNFRPGGLYTAFVVEGLTIRKATPEDADRIAEIIAGEPGQEAVGLVGDRELARRLGVASILVPGSSQGWRYSTVAELKGDVVAVIQAGEDVPEFRITLNLAWTTIRILGIWGTLRRIPRLLARNRVQPARPARAYYISEIDVDPAFRNRGIGGALLAWAERDARVNGLKRMALTTTTINPARHLYERHGFRVVETKTDPAFERYTGIEGRHLMVKDPE